MLLYGDESDPEQAEGLRAFRAIMADYSGCMRFYQPSPERAPWHVQARVLDGARADGYTPLINFWPHRNRAQPEGETSVEGEEAIRATLGRMLEGEHDEAPLFE
jgi:hypothetical protein